MYKKPIEVLASEVHYEPGEIHAVSFGVGARGIVAFRDYKRDVSAAEPEATRR
jgi:hypothetical protein